MRNAHGKIDTRDPFNVSVRTDMLARAKHE